MLNLDKNKKMKAIVAVGVIIVVLIILLLTRQTPTVEPIVEINGLPGEEILLDGLTTDPVITPDPNIITDPEPIVETPLQ